MTKTGFFVRSRLGLRPTRCSVAFGAGLFTVLVVGAVNCGGSSFEALGKGGNGGSGGATGSGDSSGTNGQGASSSTGTKSGTGAGAGGSGGAGTGGAVTGTGGAGTGGAATGGATSSSSSSMNSSSSTGGLNCTPPMADCDLDPSNGCEVDVTADPANCGQCGYACVGGSCANSACVLAQPGTLTYTFGDFQCITTDGADVYFMVSNLNGAGGSDVLYVPTGGGTVQALPGATGSRGTGLVEYGQFIYWADYNNGQILETPKPGQPGSTRTVVSGLTQPIRVAVDAVNVYWSSQIGVGAAVKATGTVLWTSVQPGGKAWSIAADATDVYYTDATLGQVVRVGIASGVASVIAPSQTGARGLFLDATTLYWTTSNGDVLMSPKLAVSPTPIVSVQNNPQEMAVDTTVSPAEVYWVNVASAGDLSKAPANAGATSTVLAPNQAYGQCVALDSTSVYWSVYGGTQLLKAAK